MAKNTGKGYRKGEVTDRSQVYNEHSDTYLKRDKKTGKFIKGKNTPFKGVQMEGKKQENSEVQESESLKFKKNKNKTDKKDKDLTSENSKKKNSLIYI